MTFYLYKFPIHYPRRCFEMVCKESVVYAKKVSKKKVIKNQAEIIYII